MLYREASRLPDCRSGVGCRIGEDLALDEEVDRVYTGFLLAQNSPGAQQSPKIFEQILNEAGLLEDLDLYFELEQIYYSNQSDRQMANQALQRTMKSGRK